MSIRRRLATVEDQSRAAGIARLVQITVDAFSAETLSAMRSDPHNRTAEQWAELQRLADRGWFDAFIQALGPGVHADQPLEAQPVDVLRNWNRLKRDVFPEIRQMLSAKWNEAE